MLFAGLSQPWKKRIFVKRQREIRVISVYAIIESKNSWFSLTKPPIGAFHNACRVTQRPICFQQIILLISLTMSKTNALQCCKNCFLKSDSNFCSEHRQAPSWNFTVGSNATLFCFALRTFPSSVARSEKTETSRNGNEISPVARWQKPQRLLSTFLFHVPRQKKKSKAVTWDLSVVYSQAVEEIVVVVDKFNRTTEDRF